MAATALLPFGAAIAQTVDAARRITDAANRFLLSLDDGQRQKAMIAFDSGNRLDWHYIPRSRPGLALGEMRASHADAARALFASVLNQRGLDERQRKAATIANRSFGEIVASPQREQHLGNPKGLLLGEMTGAQHTLVETLLDRFLGTLAADPLARQKQRVMEQGLMAFRFAWAGSLTSGEAHYFRVHGPSR